MDESSRARNDYESYFGASIREIADELGITETYAKNIKDQALAKLRWQWGLTDVPPRSRSGKPIPYDGKAHKEFYERLIKELSDET